MSTGPMGPGGAVTLSRCAGCRPSRPCGCPKPYWTSTHRCLAAPGAAEAAAAAAAAGALAPGRRLPGAGRGAPHHAVANILRRRLASSPPAASGGLQPRTPVLRRAPRACGRRLGPARLHPEPLAAPTTAAGASLSNRHTLQGSCSSAAACPAAAALGAPPPTTPARMPARRPRRAALETARASGTLAVAMPSKPPSAGSARA
mmetsp:Transcript_135170/g.420088  ORF Transcript_135170/g.420088 Transcript_135170/m.420088 type:complete len:203 (+) Transcript_135170:131-739(+)